MARHRYVHVPSKLSTVFLAGLMCYDWIINIEKDISLVWTYERVTLPKILYIAIRYPWLVFGVLDIAIITPIGSQVCTPFSLNSPVQLMSLVQLKTSVLRCMLYKECDQQLMLRTDVRILLAFKNSPPLLSALLHGRVSTSETLSVLLQVY